MGNWCRRAGLNCGPHPYQGWEKFEHSIALLSLPTILPKGSDHPARQGAINLALTLPWIAAVRDGLALRWSVIGPFETADLNARGGIAAHAERMGPAYQRLGEERGQRDPWTAELVVGVVAARRHALPLECWQERVAWSDRALMALLRCRRTEPALDWGE